MSDAMTSPQRSGVGRGLFVAIAIGFASGCAMSTDDPENGDPMALTWVSPGPTDRIESGEAIELAVMTQNPDASVVHFMVDGTEISACDRNGPDAQECHVGYRWRWTTTISTTGTHRLEAWFDRPSAQRVRAEITVRVEDPRPSLDDPDAGAEGDAEPTDDEPMLFALDAGAPAADAATGDTRSTDGATGDARVTDARVTDAALADVRVVTDSGRVDAGPPPPPPPSRGFLDPERDFHSIYGGISWAVRGQRVDLRTTDPSGSTSSIASCMARYGASIRRWGDRYRVSRASIVATAITESNCTNPAGSSDGLSSGPMQVTGSTCAAVTGLSSTTCRLRMHSNPDFSFEVGVRYMASTYQRRQHANDPPKIAAAYNAGSLRSSTANRWHMLVTGNHIDRFANAYNAYRAWERATGLGVEFAPDEMFFDGEHVATEADLPGTAREGQTYFVGDWSQRDGEFYLYFNGGWQRSVP